MVARHSFADGGIGSIYTVAVIPAARTINRRIVESRDCNILAVFQMGSANRVVKTTANRAIRGLRPCCRQAIKAMNAAS
jgi:hypothetical protein